MPTSVTGAQIMRDIALELGRAGGYSPLGTTTGAGSTSSLVDAQLTDADASTGALERALVRIDEKVGNGPEAGEWSRVRKAGLTIANGTVTFSPVLSATVESGTDYSLWPSWLPPQTAWDTLQAVLRGLRRQAYSPVSVLVNPDFENVTSGSGVDDWTYANSDVTSGNGYSNTAERVRRGVYAARLQGSGGAPSISQSVRAVEGQQWLAAARAMGDSGQPELRVYDATNAADIVEASHNEEEYMLLAPATFTVPAGCESLTYYLEGTAADDDLYFDGAVLWPVARRSYELPSWVEDPRHIVSIGYFERGQQYAGTDAYGLDEGQWRPWDWQWESDLTDEGGAHPFRILLDAPVTEPLYLRAWRPYAELSGDTDTTTAPRALLLYMVMQRVWQGRKLAAEGDEAVKYERLAAEAGANASLHMAQHRIGEPSVRVRSLRMRGYGPRHGRGRGFPTV